MKRHKIHGHHSPRDDPIGSALLQTVFENHMKIKDVHGNEIRRQIGLSNRAMIEDDLRCVDVIGRCIKEI